MLNFHWIHFQSWCTRVFDIKEIGNLINITHIDKNSEIACFLGHYLHFKFFAVKKKTAGKDTKAGKLVAVRMHGQDGKIQTAGVHAISQSDSRI